MKRYYLRAIIGLAALTFGIASPSRSEPLGNMSTPINYLVTARDLSWFGVGVYGGSIERGVEYKGDRELQGDEVMGYVNVYPLSWLSAYGAAGYGSFEFDDTTTGRGEWVAQWALGARINLIDHDVADPWIYEDRIRLNANVHYGRYDAEIGDGGPDGDWSEFKVSLLVSIVNDVVGNKHILPQTIAVYGGPVYSALGRDLEETENFGFAAGLQTQLSAHTALAVGIEDLDGTTITAGLDIRF